MYEFPSLTFINKVSLKSLNQFISFSFLTHKKRHYQSLNLFNPLFLLFFFFIFLSYQISSKIATESLNFSSKNIIWQKKIIFFFHKLWQENYIPIRHHFFFNFIFFFHGFFFSVTTTVKDELKVTCLGGAIAYKYGSPAFFLQQRGSWVEISCLLLYLFAFLPMLYVW